MGVQKTIRNRKLISSFTGVIGAMFLVVGFLMWKFGGDILGINFPRKDIAHVGFILVGFIYTMIALAIALSIKDKKSIIEDNDERNQMIYSNSGLVAFTVQSLLSTTSLFLLCYMGYMNEASMFTLIVVNVISFLVFLLYSIYLRVRA